MWLGTDTLFAVGVGELSPRGSARCAAVASVTLNWYPFHFSAREARSVDSSRQSPPFASHVGPLRKNCLGQLESRTLALEVGLSDDCHEEIWFLNRPRVIASLILQTGGKAHYLSWPAETCRAWCMNCRDWAQ